MWKWRVYKGAHKGWLAMSNIRDFNQKQMEHDYDLFRKSFLNHTYNYDTIREMLDELKLARDYFHLWNRFGEVFFELLGDGSANFLYNVLNGNIFHFDTRFIRKEDYQEIEVLYQEYGPIVNAAELYFQNPKAMTEFQLSSYPSSERSILSFSNASKEGFDLSLDQEDLLMVSEGMLDTLLYQLERRKEFVPAYRKEVVLKILEITKQLESLLEQK
jgi:hypothetical protein